MAKDLNSILELPPGGAMHSNAGEKSDRWDQGLLAQSWTSQSPAGKTKWRIKPYKCPFSGPGAPEPQASPQPGAGSTLDVHNWSCRGGGIPRANTV